MTSPNLRKQVVHELIMAVQPGIRYRWCAGGICACMGAANCSGQLMASGVTFEEWNSWVQVNPDPDLNAGEKSSSTSQLTECLREIHAGYTFEDPPEIRA
jgi:hypothetical protein